MKNGNRKLLAALMTIMLLTQFAPALASAGSTIEGIYESKKKDEMFLVTFVNEEGETLDQMSVQNGASVQGEAPDAPAREGYTFSGWQSEASELKSIISNTVFSPAYDEQAPEQPEEEPVEEPSIEEPPVEEPPVEEPPVEEPPVEEPPVEEPPVEEQPEATLSTEGQVTITRIMPDSGIIFAGDTFVLEATVVGLDDVTYETQWQYDAGEGWADIEGDGLQLTVTANEDLSNVNYDWRLILTIIEGDQSR